MFSLFGVSGWKLDERTCHSKYLYPNEVTVSPTGVAPFALHQMAVDTGSTDQSTIPDSGSTACH